MQFLSWDHITACSTPNAPLAGTAYHNIPGVLKGQLLFQHSSRAAISVYRLGICMMRISQRKHLTESPHAGGRKEAGRRDGVWADAAAVPPAAVVLMHVATATRIPTVIAPSPAAPDPLPSGLRAAAAQTADTGSCPSGNHLAHLPTAHDGNGTNKSCAREREQHSLSDLNMPRNH